MWCAGVLRGEQGVTTIKEEGCPMKNGCSSIAIGIILEVAAVMVILLGAAMTFLSARVYYANVRVIAERSEAASQATGTPARDEARAFFLQDQVEILRSQKIGYPLVEKEQLVAKWQIGGPENMAREQAFQIMRSRLNVQPVRGSNVIEAGFYSTDPVEAADLANAIVEVYRDIMGREPHNYRVTIIDQARPPTAPAKPNVPLYLLVSLGLAAPFALGGVFLIVLGQKNQRTTQPPTLRRDTPSA